MQNAGHENIRFQRLGQSWQSDLLAGVFGLVVLLLFLLSVLRLIGHFAARPR